MMATQPPFFPRTQGNSRASCPLSPAVKGESWQSLSLFWKGSELLSLALLLLNIFSNCWKSWSSFWSDVPKNTCHCPYWYFLSLGQYFCGLDRDLGFSPDLLDLGKGLGICSRWFWSLVLRTHLINNIPDLSSLRISGPLRMELTCWVRSQKSCLMQLRAEETQDLSSNTTEGVMLSQTRWKLTLSLFGTGSYTPKSICVHIRAKP